MENRKIAQIPGIAMPGNTQGRKNLSLLWGILLEYNFHNKK